MHLPETQFCSTRFIKNKYQQLNFHPREKLSHVKLTSPTTQTINQHHLVYIRERSHQHLSQSHNFGVTWRISFTLGLLMTSFLRYVILIQATDYIHEVIQNIVPSSGHPYMPLWITFLLLCSAHGSLEMASFFGRKPCSPFDGFHIA